MTVNDRHILMRTGASHSAPRHRTFVALAVAVLVSACVQAPAATPGGGSDVGHVDVTDGQVVASSSTTLGQTPIPPPAEIATFSIPVGAKSITYDLDGEPASGPSSFAVANDGTVYVADTIAVRDGPARLLSFTATGDPLETIDLGHLQVASVVDIATDGTALAILDVDVKFQLYRVHRIHPDGELVETTVLPAGYRFEDGLSGLAWDDDGILLEFEGGAWYRRLGSDPAIDRLDVPSWNGTAVTVGASDGGSADVCVEAECFTVLRTSELGGVQLIGVDIHGGIHLLVTDVHIGDTVEVTETIRTYQRGQLVGSSSFEVSDQFVDVPHAYEVTSSGQILHLRTERERVLVEVVNAPPGGGSGA